MTLENTSGFIIQGFSDTPELQISFFIPLFVTFLLIFLIIMIGNSTIFTTITLIGQLHTPMYMFLGSLSLLDISYTSTTLPKLLLMLCTQDKTISFAGCIIQLYFFIGFTCTEFLLLSVMAYDRYVAICRPLHYTLVMSLKHCVRLIIVVWAAGFLDTAPFALLIKNFTFCASHHIEHFFCDFTPVLKITCSDTSTIELLTYMNGVFMAFSAFTLTSASYIVIICTVVTIQSSEGRKKAFSTCASHLICVTVFYGTIICSYIRPVQSYTPKQDTYLALLYTVLVPMLNPFIYTMKNKEFKDGFGKLRARIALHLEQGT
uniref:Olfactory receptor n=1 Tax=Xenopus tropicalis TaxID=8364 RepID=A0A6I8R6M0_XENTR